MQFYPMFLEAREIGERTVVWFDGFTPSARVWVEYSSGPKTVGAHSIGAEIAD
jgi:hypothetical protein